MNLASWIISGLRAVVFLAGTISTHLHRHEAQEIVVNLAVLALAVLVARGRLGPRSLTG